MATFNQGHRYLNNEIEANAVRFGTRSPFYGIDFSEHPVLEMRVVALTTGIRLIATCHNHENIGIEVNFARAGVRSAVNSFLRAINLPEVRDLATFNSHNGNSARSGSNVIATFHREAA